MFKFAIFLDKNQFNIRRFQKNIQYNPFYCLKCKGIIECVADICIPVMNEDISIGMRKRICKLKRKQHRYRFIIIPRVNEAIFYSTNIFLFLPVLTSKYMKFLKGVSRKERIRFFHVVLSLHLPFRGGRSPPANLDFQQKIQIGGKEYEG